jgi:hypothetical protein
MKIVISSILISLLPFAASAQSNFYEGANIFVCLSKGGSCKARVIRVGSDTIHIEYSESCQIEYGAGKLKFGLFGLADIEAGDKEWVEKSQTGRWSTDCP